MYLKNYDTHCIFRLIHLYSSCICCSVETHGYTFLDLHKQTDRLYKLLDDQKNHTNRDQSLTLTKCFLHHHLDCRGCVISRARAVSIANLVMIRKGSSQLTFRVFLFIYIHTYIYIYIYIYIYTHFFKLTLRSNISSEIEFDNFLLHSHQIHYSLRGSFQWFSFFTLEGTYEDLEWALLDTFTSYFIL